MLLNFLRIYTIEDEVDAKNKVNFYGQHVLS